MSPSTAKPERIGIGLYSIPEAARLLGVQQNRVRRWIDPQGGLILRTLPLEERTLSFVELMELYFVKLFRESGVSLQTIRKASKAAAKRFDSTYPFAVKRFDTDGRTLFATLLDTETDEESIEDLKRGQLVFKQIMRPFFHKLDYEGLEASRFWPLGKRHRIVLDPKRQFGKPIIANTGVSTETLVQALKANDGDKALVADWFHVPIKAVEEAARFESQLTSAT